MKRIDSFELKEKVNKEISVSYDSKSNLVHVSKDRGVQGLYSYSSMMNTYFSLEPEVLPKLIKALQKIEKGITDGQQK